jgi:hypothetical protein
MENCMEVVKLKSGSILEEKEGYSRIVALDNWIFMSLTAGRDYKTRAMPDSFQLVASAAALWADLSISSKSRSLRIVVRAPFP